MLNSVSIVLVCTGVFAQRIVNKRTLVSISKPNAVLGGLPSPLSNVIDVRDVPNLLHRAQSAVSAEVETYEDVEACFHREGAVKSLDRIGVQVVDTDSTVCGLTTTEVCSYLTQASETLGIAAACGPNLELKPVGTLLGTEYVFPRKLQTDDPLAEEQDYLTQLKYYEAMEALDASGISPSNTSIAILDTGVDVDHEDLRDIIYTFPDGSRGYDFYNDIADPSDEDGHGTHCAGIAAADSNNGAGIAGISNAQIMALKFLTGFAGLEHALAALNFAVENGATVSSHSYGQNVTGSDAFPSFEQGFANAAAQGHFIVAASGNEGMDLDKGVSTVPCQYALGNENMLCVTSSDDDSLTRVVFNYGSPVEIAGAGVGVVSTVPRGYDDYSGTSMACPQVAGAAALLVSIGLAPSEVKRTLLETAAGDLISPDGEPLGIGLLDLHAAVTSVLQRRKSRSSNLRQS